MKEGTSISIDKFRNIGQSVKPCIGSNAHAFAQESTLIDLQRDLDSEQPCCLSYRRRRTSGSCRSARCLSQWPVSC